MANDLSNQRKDLIRRSISSLRKAMTDQEHRERSALICERLIQVLAGIRPASTVAAFMPYRNETDIEPFLHYCWNHGFRIAIPKSEPATRQMKFYYIGSMLDLAEEPGAYGIREPRAGLQELTDLSTLEFVLVPGLAFDLTLARLGYGGGFYDRWLTALTRQGTERALLVSPAFELQIVPDLPVDEHDIRMDVIVTEKRIIRRNRV